MIRAVRNCLIFKQQQIFSRYFSFWEQCVLDIDVVFLLLKDEFEHKSSHLLGDSFLPLIQQLNDHVVQHEASLLESTKQLRAAVCAELCIAFCIVTVTHCVSLKAEKCEDLVKQHTADQRRSLDVVSNVLQNEKSRQVGTMYMVIACEEKLLIFRYQLFKHTKIALHVHLNNRKLCRR